jgi:acyl carrier protein
MAGGPTGASTRGRRLAMSWTRNQVEQAVKEVIAEQLGLESTERVTEHAHFFDDLGGDSLDLAEATMSLEDRLDVNVPDGDVSPRVGEIVSMLMKHLEESAVAR